MTDTQYAEPVAVVLEHDIPVRMTWKGVRFYVDGRPVPLGRTVPTKKGADPNPAFVTGWRFRATSVKGESHTFEIVSTRMAGWNLRAAGD